MELGKTIYITRRSEWRDWLSANHKKEKEIWLIGYPKKSGKPSLPYNDAVEEALCFGWIDSTIKKVDEERNAQRYTPRRSNSPWSEMNKETCTAIDGCRLDDASRIGGSGGPIHRKIQHTRGYTASAQGRRTSLEEFRRFP